MAGGEGSGVGGSPGGAGNVVRVSRGMMVGRTRKARPTRVTIDPESLDVTGLTGTLSNAQIIDLIRPKIEERVLAIMAQVMADWEMRAKAKAPVRKQHPKAGARGQRVTLRPASQFPDYVKGEGSHTREHRLMTPRGIREIPIAQRPGLLRAMSRTGNYAQLYRFTRSAGLFAGRSPALVEGTRRGGLRGYFKGQLTGVAGGTLRDSIKIESIKLVAPAAPAVAAAKGVLAATAPYALPVHEGRHTGKRGRVGRRPFMTAAAKEVTANIAQGRYTGKG